MTTIDTGELTFCVLGPLEVRLAGQVMEIGGVKPRLVLATLLLNANRPVTFDRLIESVWPATPPRSAMGKPVYVCFWAAARAAVRGQAHN
jgi:DNA-binding SARP family transcriptional activator